MKKMLVLVMVCLLPVLGEAKTTIRVCKDIIEIKVGNITYVSNLKTPDKLAMVRVWKGPDSLMFDLTATEVDYSRSYGNAPKKEMPASEAAKKWAEYVKKFEELQKEIEVVIE